jgi:hypothetical protein
MLLVVMLGVEFFIAMLKVQAPNTHHSVLLTWVKHFFIVMLNGNMLSGIILNVAASLTYICGLLCIGLNFFAKIGPSLNLSIQNPSYWNIYELLNWKFK